MNWWPVAYLVLSALAFWQYVREGETVEAIHFAVAGSVLLFLAIMDAGWGWALAIAATRSPTDRTTTAVPPAASTRRA